MKLPFSYGFPMLYHTQVSWLTMGTTFAPRLSMFTRRPSQGSMLVACGPLGHRRYFFPGTTCCLLIIGNAL